MERAEIKRIAVLGWSVLWFLARGRFPEALAHLRCLFIRGGENVIAGFGPPVVTCGFCDWSGRKFMTFAAGRWTRPNALCPRCGSLERHRKFIDLFRRIRVDLPPRIHLLDIAPTEAFAAWCRRDADIDYLSIDLVSPLAMRHMDLQRLDLPDAAFHAIVCTHVLDYVPDDRRAMGEIRRVLDPDGVAILQEQYDRHRPTEEWGAPDPVRLGRVRSWGRDFPGRLEAAGFSLRHEGDIILARRMGGTA